MSHFTRSEREQLQALREAGVSQTGIATIIGCSQATVSRELQRNHAHPRLLYDAEQAQAHADDRRTHAKDVCPRWHDDPQVLRYVVEQLRQRRSPDQIERRMKRESPWHRAHAVSAKTIYAYIWSLREEGGCLHLHLRRRGRRPRWFGFGKTPQGIIPGRRDISERPKVVDRCTRYGDWESDLVVGKSAVATFVERQSKYLRAVVLANQSAPEFLRAARQTFVDLPPSLRKTLTHDNGREICCHEQITQELKLAVYCARPYHAWERGLNEHTNGLLRDFFPKRTDFRTVSQAELDHVVDLINDRPRRSLQYRTPAEVLRSVITQQYAFQGSH